MQGLEVFSENVSSLRALGVSGGRSYAGVFSFRPVGFLVNPRILLLFLGAPLLFAFVHWLSALALNLFPGRAFLQANAAYSLSGGGTNTESPPMLFPSLEGPNPEMRIVHRIKRGDTLQGLIRHYGLAAGELQPWYETYRAVIQKNKLSPSLRKGQELELQVNAEGSLDGLVLAYAPGQQLLFSRTARGEVTGLLRTKPQVTQERLVAGEIENSFAQAAYSVGLPYEAIDDIVDLFGDRIAFHRDFRRGDRFSVIYRDGLASDGTPLGMGAILAAAIEVEGHSYLAVRYVGSDGVARYFDEKGELIGNAFLRFPLKFTRISSHFSESRFHPVLKHRRPHHGVDFAAPVGTPVRTVADGRVEFAGRRGGSGIMVKIEHGPRFTTAYLHLSQIAPGLKTGAKVRRGQLIGSVGMTGLATGPHLHYSLYDRGKYVDPLKSELPRIAALQSGMRIDSQYLTRVKYTLEHYQSIEVKQLYWN